MDLLNQFTIYTIYPLKLFGFNISITNSSLFMFIAVIMGSIMFLPSLKKYKIPSYWQSCNELFYNFISELVEQYIGKDAKKYTPFFFTLFLFVFLGNFLGLFPGSFTFTSQIITTLMIALFVFVLSISVGLKTHGMKFFTLFVPKGVPVVIVPLIFLIELALFFVKPLVMALRLCVNMIAGHIILKVILHYSITLGFLKFLPVFSYSIILLFELGVAAFQAYIFVLLSCFSLKDTLHLH